MADGATTKAGGIRDAAAVLLVREEGGRRELFWVRRSREVSLGGGFHAFPGGRVDESDVQLAARVNTDPLRISAIRELFEETGVLLVRGTFDAGRLARERQALLDGKTTFGNLLSTHDLWPDVDALAPAGRWLTPDFMRTRYDARFFLAAMPAGQATEVWPGELVSGEWTTPEDALDRWQSGRALLHPPALHLVESLRDAPPPACLAAMNAPLHTPGFVAERIEFQRGILIVPQRTPTLPPATHTNCYLVGEGELVVIDPASVHVEEQEKLARLCRLLVAEGRKFREILLTHEHHDHVGGVEAFRREFAVPVRAHRITAEKLEGILAIDGFIEADERIALPGPRGLTLRALFTPGHTRGHLCFLEETSGALFAGDMVAGVGSIVVDPPDGDMADYVASLKLMRSLPVNALYPAHGPVVADGIGKLDEYLAHREAREKQVVQALVASGGGTAEELVPHVYTDVPKSSYPLAARSLEAVLEKLVKERRAIQDGETFRLA